MILSSDCGPRNPRSCSIGTPSLKGRADTGEAPRTIETVIFVRRRLPMAVVAERAFTSRSTLQKVEAGDTNVSIARATALARP